MCIQSEVLLTLSGHLRAPGRPLMLDPGTSTRVPAGGPAHPCGGSLQALQNGMPLALLGHGVGIRYPRQALSMASMDL